MILSWNFFSSLIHRGIGYDMSLASSERALPACLPRDWSAPPCRSLVHRCRIFLRRWKPTSLRATSTTKTLLFHQKHHFYATIFARPVKITSRWCKPQIYEEPRSRDPRASACMLRWVCIENFFGLEVGECILHGLCVEVSEVLFVEWAGLELGSYLFPCAGADWASANGQMAVCWGSCSLGGQGGIFLPGSVWWGGQLLMEVVFWGHRLASCGNPEHLVLDCLSQLVWLILGAKTRQVYARVLLRIDLYVSRNISLSWP